MVPKSVTLNGEMALFCVIIIPNLVVFRANCVKVVDKAITMNIIYDYNLRLLSSSKHMQRDRARPTVYKFLADS